MLARGILAAVARSTNKSQGIVLSANEMVTLAIMMIVTGMLAMCVLGIGMRVIAFMSV